MRVDWIWLYLKPRGRLTRLPYFLAMTLLSLITAFFAYRIVMAHFPAYIDDPWATPGLMEFLQGAFLVTLWPTIALTAKRLQDVGLSPFLGALVAVPAVSVFVYLALCFAPGKDEPNAYGRERNGPPEK